MAGFELYAPRTERHRRTWTWAVIVLGIVFMMLSGLIVAVPYIVQSVQAMQANPALHRLPPPPANMGTWMLFLPDALLIACILVWVAAFERRLPEAIGFNANGLWRFVRGYLIGCGFLVTVVCGLWAVGVYQVESPGAWAAPTVAALLPILGYAGMFIVQGSSEEVFMRGWLMQIVASRRGIVWAVITNSLVFGAMHLLNIQPSPAMFAGCANVALFGVFISLYACRERSIWGVCGWHAAWNWLLGIGFGLEVSGLNMKVTPLIVNLKDAPNAPWWLSGGVWGPEASIFTTAVLLAGIVFLLWKGALKPGESYPVPASTDPAAQF